MNILVTGGAGFIGTNLSKTLLKKGHTVTSIDNYYTGLKSNHIEGCTYINSDIRDIKDYSVWGKFDMVYHLAALARIQPSFKTPIKTFETNVNGTLLIAEYCAKNDIPLFYAGSSSHHSGKFKNPYTYSKEIGEEIIQLYQKHYGLKASIARFYNVYGPHHLKEGAYCTVIGKWETALENKQPLTIYGDGTKRRDFTHVEDIVNALVLILQKQAWGYIFELGRGINYSIQEIADMFNNIKSYGIVYEENKPGEALATLCTDTLAKEILGWEPILKIEDYIQNQLIHNK
jgi:UDP-glucose 4-epimerase